MATTVPTATGALAGIFAVAMFAACARGVPDGTADPLLRVVVLSDFNSAYGSTSYEPEVHTAVSLVTEKWRPDLVLIAGDMVAGQRPSLTDTNVRAMWAAFDSVVAGPLRAADIPLAFTIGNHDGSGHPGHERDRRLAREHWRAPAVMPTHDFVDSSDFPFRYAFRHGNVFFVVIDASTGAVAGDTDQLDWLRSTLATDAARNAAVRIALGHVPLYAVAEGRNRAGEVQAEPDSLRRILERGGVVMYVAGHHHAYYPGSRGGLMLLSAGALGQSPRPHIGSDGPPFKALTLLTLARDGTIRDRTFGIAGDSTWRVDPRTLPPRIDGINGHVERAEACPPCPRW